jgi:hypothetical protein
MPNSLALQLYSLRHETATDPEGIVRRVPTLGFDSVEIAGTYGWSAEQWTKILAEARLRVVGAHVGLEALEKEWDAQTRFQRAIGNKRLVIPSLPKNLQTADGYSEAAKRLKALGQRAKAEGLACSTTTTPTSSHRSPVVGAAWTSCWPKPTRKS